METDGTVAGPATTRPPRTVTDPGGPRQIPQPRTDAATFAAHLGEGSDDPHERAEHLRRCRPCAEVTRELRSGPAAGPDLELRLLHAFQEWRDT
jgi:hypothetical protein